MTKLEQILRTARENYPFYILGFIIAFGMKHHYSESDVDNLRWILVPIAHLVTYLTEISFEYELHTGFISQSHRVIIAPSCAGINFLVICFSALFFTLVSRFKKSTSKCIWLVGSLYAAYVITLCANTLRIVVSIRLYGAHIYNGWITPERIHRLEGTLIYVCFLVIAYLAAEKITKYPRFSGIEVQKDTSLINEQPRPVILILFVPFVWYLLIAVFIPLLNIAGHQKGSPFIEHMVFVVIVCFCVLLICLFIAVFFHKSVDIFNERKRK